MPLPTFSKASHPLGTLTFSRQYAFPIDDTHEANQVIGFTLGGLASGSRAIKVLDLGGIEKRLRLRWQRLPKSEAESVRAWLEHSFINYAQTSFTFTDVFSVARTVRYVEGRFDIIETMYQLASSIEIGLRIEA